MKNRKAKDSRPRKGKSRVLISGIAALMVVAIASIAFLSSRTAEAQRQRIEEQVDNNDVSIQFASQEITIDARTGKLRRPTVEEARAIVNTLTKLTKRSSEDLHVETTSRGSKVDLQDGFQSVILAKPDPANGRYDVECFNNAEAGAAFLGIDPSKIPAK
jgi:hypothetical protein